MGIYIPGMEFPENYKRMILMANGDLTDLDGKTIAKAIELPPHGRLGDLDALYKIAVSRTEKSWGCFNEMERVISPRDIRLTPAIIPADGGEKV